jgi:hypothetical protein
MKQAGNEKLLWWEYCTVKIQNSMLRKMFAITDFYSERFWSVNICGCYIVTGRGKNEFVRQIVYYSVLPHILWCEFCTQRKGYDSVLQYTSCLVSCLAVTVIATELSVPAFSFFSIGTFFFKTYNTSSTWNASLLSKQKTYFGTPHSYDCVCMW